MRGAAGLLMAAAAQCTAQLGNLSSPSGDDAVRWPDFGNATDDGTGGVVSGIDSTHNMTAGNGTDGIGGVVSGADGDHEMTVGCGGSGPGDDRPPCPPAPPFGGVQIGEIVMTNPLNDFHEYLHATAKESYSNLSKIVIVWVD